MKNIFVVLVGRSILAFLVLLFFCQQVYMVPVPEDCSSEPYRDINNISQKDGLALDCHLSAINSQQEKTNFSVIPAQHTVALTVRCSDSISLSHLEPNGLRSLVWLEELTIKDCNLKWIPDRAFDGLTRLKKLNIKSFSSDEYGLTFSRGAFEGLANLKSLDLSENKVIFKEKGVLCSLPNLLHLNISYCELNSIENLGLASSHNTFSQTANCLRNVQDLDLRGNQLESVMESQLLHFPNLHRLDLSWNMLLEMTDDVFTHTKELAELDISNNQLSTLPQSIFTSRLSFPMLKQLSAANNSIHTLSVDIHSDKFNSLEVLNLSGNLLTSSEIKPFLFSQLKELRILDLSHNQIDKLKRKIFWNLTKLDNINLSHNKINEIPNKLFKYQQDLRILDLSNNILTKLDIFNGLKMINHLYLQHNLIENIDEQLFANMSNELSLLDLSNNHLLTVPKSLKFLRNLKSIDLSGNYITDLEVGGTSIQLPQLWRLNLSNNKIGNVSASALKNLKSLQILDLSENRIDEVERSAFDFNKLLRAVRLDNNKIHRMDNLFHQLPNLTWLNISDNRIEVFDYAMVPRNLLWLDIHKNFINSLENYFGIDDGTTVKHIDAGFNRISNVGPLNVPKSVEILLLNDNDISEIAPYTFFEKSYLKKVDLTVNRMSAIERKSLRLSTDLIQQPKFLFGGNPVECDCQMVWFKSINDQSSSLQNLPYIADLESIYCKFPYSREMTFSPLVDASPREFLCSYETHCFALCHCCDYDACDCEMACPDQCSCYHDNTWTKNIAECSNANYTDLPSKLPMDATEIFLDGNVIHKLKSHTFIGRKNLRILYLNSSKIEIVENNTFNGLPSMTVLHLDNNKISKLEGDEFQGLSSLRELYLQDNIISYISNVTFLVLHNLEVLHLQGNKIVEYPVWTLAINTYLMSIQLEDNMWSCDCTYVQKFSSWLHQYKTKVSDSHLLGCTLNDRSFLKQTESLFLMSNTSSCLDTREITLSHTQSEFVMGNNISEIAKNMQTLLQSERTKNILTLLGAIVAAISLILIVCLLVFIYRSEICIWLHSKYGVRFFERVENEEDQEKLFDAFVAYSSSDEMYVRQVFAPELELGASQYRLCLYHRDLPVLHYVADAIVQASEASRRTIVVLSDSFLKEEWSRYDFRSGLNQSLRTMGKKVVFIVLGDFMGHDMDPELKLYLKNATVIHWGDTKFWHKIKFCLPDSTVHALSQSTTLQSYPGSGVQYAVSPEIYNNSTTCPRYQATPRQIDHIYQVCA